MKLSLVLSCSLLTVPVNGWGSSSSAFTSRLSMTSSPTFGNDNLVMYDSPSDPPNKRDRGNMWTVLADTERWIHNTLSSQGAQNPYTRKEVSYVCENNDEPSLILAGIFRRLREARELGEQHGQTEEERMLDQDKVFSPRTLRQTQVIVIPYNDKYKKSFHVFDSLVEAVNQARRNARDYVTDVSLEKLEDGERDWSVSVNCAHLHPSFGELSPQDTLKQMQEEDEAGEVDLNLQSYKEKRLLARRSPYPTVVVEVRSTPPPDFTPPPSKEEEEVTSQDVQRLEALFGKSALNHPTQTTKSREDDFYNAIGKTAGIDELSLVTPMILCQNWIAKHDEKFNPDTSTFTASDTKHVDGGYEFVFNNLAMQVSVHQGKDPSHYAGMRQYLVMDNFLTSSATSFEKFAKEVTTMTEFLPGLKGKLQVDTFHPEHVDPEKRAPVPVFVWTWV